MKQRVKSKSPSKLSRKRVEDRILLYLKEGKATADTGFGEVEVKVPSRELFNNYHRAFREFSIDNIRYVQAAKDESKLTITYLFH